MAECYIRGITIKYIRIPDEVIDMMKDDMVMKNRARGDSRPGRGNPGARGRNAPRGDYIFNHQLRRTSYLFVISAQILLLEYPTVTVLAFQTVTFHRNMFTKELYPVKAYCSTTKDPTNI